MAVVPPHRVARLALGAILVGMLVLGDGSVSSGAEASVAPRCSYADTLTRYRARSDWYRSLLDTRYRLSSAYTPLDLVPANRSGASGTGSVRRIALADLTAMYRASRSAGAPFAIQSGFRSYTTQVFTFNRWVLEEGYAAALLGSARPGHSEHQLGTALDLKTPGGPPPWYTADWGQTRAGSWIARNSWRYGWIISYPKGKSPSATCYRYEPWHVRYFGRIIAARIHRSELAAREWLYVKGATSTWIGGGPFPTPTPTPTPTPAPTPAPSAAPSASPGASPTPSPAPPDAPSDAPSASPSAAPSEVPPAPPSQSPTAEPTATASAAPSPEPSASPSPEPVRAASPTPPDASAP